MNGGMNSPRKEKKVHKCILVIHIIKSFGWEQSIYLNLWNLRKRLAVLTGWITTINGFLQVASTLQNLGYDKFPTRPFNQDNWKFFGQLRQYGGRTNNPMCVAFVPYFKLSIKKI